MYVYFILSWVLKTLLFCEYNYAHFEENSTTICGGVGFKAHVLPRAHWRILPQSEGLQTTNSRACGGVGVKALAPARAHCQFLEEGHRVNLA